MAEKTGCDLANINCNQLFDIFTFLNLVVILEGEHFVFLACSRQQ